MGGFVELKFIVRNNGDVLVKFVIVVVVFFVGVVYESGIVVVEVVDGGIKWNVGEFVLGVRM